MDRTLARALREGRRIVNAARGESALSVTQQRLLGQGLADLVMNTFEIDPEDRTSIFAFILGDVNAVVISTRVTYGLDDLSEAAR